MISDTHGQHRDLPLPEGELLVHAGDLSSKGKQHEIEDFLEWFAAQPHPHKVFVAGNHDFFAEEQPEAMARLIPEGVTYLNDSGVEVEGIRIWGSPVQPWFHDWAFNRQRGADIARHWELIPNDTDLLITHGPPFGILDETARGPRVGCEELTQAVERIRPRVHVFGHIHEAYGTLEQEGTLYVNASVLNLRYYLVNPPVVVDWEDLRP